MALHIQSEIKMLSDSRYEYIDIHNKSWDDDLGNYTTEEPKEIDELSDKIYDLLVEYQKTLSFEFIIEELTKLGQAPCLLYDDNGHFAVVGSGFQSLPSGDDTEDITSSFIVEKELWFDTIREALTHYLSL